MRLSPTVFPLSMLGKTPARQCRRRAVGIRGSLKNCAFVGPLSVVDGPETIADGVNAPPVRKPVAENSNSMLAN